MADQQDVASILRVQVQALGEHARIVFGEEIRDLDADGVGQQEARNEVIRGLARAGQRAVPDLRGAKVPAGAEETREAGDLAAPPRAERPHGILLQTDRMGMAQEVEQHGDSEEEEE
jgi:hypothetical protein